MEWKMDDSYKSKPRRSQSLLTYKNTPQIRASLVFLLRSKIHGDIS
jgi:hypothetical protein